jgi:hypothetical protein
LRVLDKPDYAGIRSSLWTVPQTIFSKTSGETDRFSSRELNEPTSATISALPDGGVPVACAPRGSHLAMEALAEE